MTKISKVQLGSTGVMVSRVGLGAVKFGRTECLRYPFPFDLPSDASVRLLLDLARENGVNLLDTAPSYGASEERLGRLLPGRREDWVIVTKCGEEFADGKSDFDFTARHLEDSLHRSLARLKTDYVDVLLVHSNGDDERIIEEFAVFDTLNKLKRKGLVRAIGFSGKTATGALAAMPFSDVLMVSLNPQWLEAIPVIERAKKLGKGILTKHTLNSGRLGELNADDPVTACLQLALEKCGVDSALIGTSNPVHLKETIDKAIEVIGPGYLSSKRSATGGLRNVARESRVELD